MPGRTFTSQNYRFGFNGHEKDDEMKGEGNSLDFGARIYDSRLGKFLSADPWESKYAWQSPYAYFANSPISIIDWKGLGNQDQYLSVEKSGVDTEKSKNKDGTYTFTLDGIRKPFENVTMEKINGEYYFQIKTKVFYKNGKWKKSGNNKYLANSYITEMTSTYVDDYAMTTLKERFGRPLTEDEYGVLEGGCIGVVRCNVGETGNIDYNLSYYTLGQAEEAQLKLQTYVDNNPKKYAKGTKVFIYSKRFYNPNPLLYTPDENGQIEMHISPYEYSGKPGGYNYDYAFLNSNGMWEGANHLEAKTSSGPSMRVKTTTLAYYSKFSNHFNLQVFSVVISKRK